MTFDRFTWTETEVEAVLGLTEARGTNPAGYRLWSRPLRDWAPGAIPDFEDMERQIVQLVQLADLAGIDGGRHLTLSIRALSAHGKIVIPASFTTLAVNSGLELVVSLWDDEAKDVEVEQWRLTVSTHGKTVFSTEAYMDDLEPDVFSRIQEGEETTVVIAHNWMHADVRLSDQVLQEIHRTGADLKVQFRDIDSDRMQVG